MMDHANMNMRLNKKRRKKGTCFQRKMILSYLQEYQERALLSYNNSAPSQQQQPLTVSARNSFINRPQPIVIGKVNFPRLDDEKMDQPYLALPKELSAYQRAIVHELCTDILKLFHCGVDGVNEGERFVAVSIYSDGLNHVPGILVDSCSQVNKPWIMRHCIDQGSLVEVGKGKINQMVDQPGRCLRDEHDTINLEKMEHDDLTTIKPPEQEDNICMLVNSAKLMKQCIKELEEYKPAELGFDLECYNKNRNQQMTCLIQLATNDGREYIIDVLGDKGKVWNEVEGLAKVFADSTIVKIGHGIQGLDIQSLQRDFGIFVVNAFDTYEAAEVLGLKGKSLAKVCAHYGLPDFELYNSLKRKYQAADWTKRPLTNKMILYGRYDVHYLVHLRRLMMRDLIKSELPMQAKPAFQLIRTSNKAEDVPRSNFSDVYISHANNEKMKIFESNKTLFYAEDLRMSLNFMKVISKSQGNCLKLWNAKPESFLQNKIFLFLAGKEWSKSQLDLYSKLASWRELVAKEEESLPGVICSLDFLVRVAYDRPVTESGLRKIRFDIPSFLTKYDAKYMKVMLEFVKDSLLLDKVEVSEEVFPTYEEYRMLKLLSLKENYNEGRRSITSLMFLATTFAALITAAICFSHGKIKGKRK